MKRNTSILLFVSFAMLSGRTTVDAYELQFSRFFGGAGWEYTRDVTTDSSGNIYVAGGTTSPGSVFTHAYGDLGGRTDVLVAKFAPDGQLLWSTIIGGSGNGDDYAYGLEVDGRGYVYVTGRAAPGFPTTPSALQRTFQGVSGGHGDQNAFVLKLAPAGTLVFSTYFGTGSANRDLDLDQDGDIYLVHRWIPSAGQKPLPSSWFTNAFQKTPRRGNDGVVAKMTSDGSRVVWATYIGGSGAEIPASTVRVASTGEVYYCCVTESDDIPTSVDAYDRSLNGPNDAYVAKFSNDGSTLLFGTYFGGSGSDFIANCHNMDIDSQGNVFIVGEATSTDLPTTPGVVQTSYAGAASGAWEHTGDYFVAKISSTGRQLLACTYYGGSLGERTVEGVDVDSSGNIYFSGGTFSTDFHVTNDAFRSRLSGSHDGVLVKLSSDLTQTLYATYMGDSGKRSFRCCTTDGDFNFIGSGPADSTWPILNSAPYGGGGTDVILVKFTVAAPCR